MEGAMLEEAGKISRRNPLDWLNFSGVAWAVFSSLQAIKIFMGDPFRKQKILVAQAENSGNFLEICRQRFLTIGYDRRAADVVQKLDKDERKLVKKPESHVTESVTWGKPLM